MTEERFEGRLIAEAAELAKTAATHVPDPSVYYRVHAPDEKRDGLAEPLRQTEMFDAVYIKGLRS
jgi:hypothetical protein